MAGLARTFKIGWLVQGDIDMLPISPVFPEQMKDQAVGLDFHRMAIDHHTVYRHFAIRDQSTTIFARAEALGLQDAV